MKLMPLLENSKQRIEALHLQQLLIDRGYEVELQHASDDRIKLILTKDGQELDKNDLEIYVNTNDDPRFSIYDDDGAAGYDDGDAQHVVNDLKMNYGL